MPTSSSLPTISTKTTPASNNLFHICLSLCLWRNARENGTPSAATSSTAISSAGWHRIHQFLLKNIPARASRAMVPSGNSHLTYPLFLLEFPSTHLASSTVLLSFNEKFTFSCAITLSTPFTSEDQLKVCFPLAALVFGPQSWPQARSVSAV